MLSPRIEILKEKKLVGKHANMTLAGNKTSLLWQCFMQARRTVKNAVGNDLYSIQIYPVTYFENFNPNTGFEKWATVEVTDFDRVPDVMEPFTLPGGLYAVFTHRGGPATGAQTFQAILGTWLPGSEFTMDNRPHFEVLGEKYKNNDPDSEEELWIPIRAKE